VNDIHTHEKSDLQDVLQAEVCNGASGERLTVTLALSHLGFNPDLEAERLSALCRASGARELADVIAATPGSTWDFEAVTVLSDHLVRLLPVHPPIGGA
jgi:hypothetical protein